MTKEEIVFEHLMEMNRKYGGKSTASMLKIIDREFSDEMYNRIPASEFIYVLDAMQQYADQETAALKAENESLKAVLKELVELDEMVTVLRGPYLNAPIMEKIQADLRERYPLAWEAARKLVKP